MKHAPARPLMHRLMLAEGQAEIRLSPEPETARLLIGKTAEDAVRLVGLVHNLCGEAHRAAARAALGLAVEPGAAQKIRDEIIRGHLMVLARHAPAAMGVGVALPPEAFSGLNRRDGRHEAIASLFCAGTAACFMPEKLLRSGALMPLFTAVSRLEEQAGWRNLEATAPVLDHAIADPRFHAPPGTGPLGCLLLARLFGLLDCAALEGEALAERFAARTTAAGEGRIEVARGTLTHRATQGDGRITHYGIETPTTVMLAPGSGLDRFLTAIGRGKRARLRHVHLALAAFDPCVPYQVIFHASEPERTEEWADA